MATPANPILIRDVSKGRITKKVVGTALVPPNSVSETINVNYDMLIGNGVVRPGSTRLGADVAPGMQALGLDTFVANAGALNLLLAVFKGVTNATLYFYNGVWNTSTLNALSNTAKVRFAVLGNRVFEVNGVDAMKSSADANTWTTDDCITTDGIIPFIITRTKSRLIVAATTPNRDRVYFSSIIDPTTAPFITWNTNPTTGDWIDINPDDGQTMTAFLDVSNQVLVFKTGTMYRLNVITKTVDTDNVYNIGAVSQEAVTLCQGIGYFYSGGAIYATDGGAPQQISRAGIQDLIDQIPLAEKQNVTLGSDENNVYVSIGSVTIAGSVYDKVQLKFSVRDQSWSVHSYQKRITFFAQYTLPNGEGLFGATTIGDVIQMNVGTTDDGKPIYYQLDTQEIDCGNRAHVKAISDEMTVYTENGQDSQLFYSADGKDFKPLKPKGGLTDRVTIIEEVDIEFRFVVFRWMGNASGKAPVFQGLQVEQIVDQGTIGNTK